MAPTGPTRYQEYGLRIPLYDKHGKELQHARSAEELEALGRNVLRRIVEMYDRQNGYKLFDLLKTDAGVARWIERVETLALGPHPESKLPCKFYSSGYYRDADYVVATEKEDILVALKFKKAPQSQTKNDTPGKKLNPQQAASLPKAKAPQQTAPPNAKVPQQAAPPKAKAPQQAAQPPKAEAPQQAAPPRPKAPQQAAPPPKIKAPQSQAKQDAPAKKLNPQTASSPPKVKAPQSLSSLSKQDAPGKQLNPQKAPPPPKAKAPTKPSAPPAPNAERKKEQEPAKPSSIPLQGKAPTNKRKLDENAATSDAPESLVQKKRKLATPAPSDAPQTPAKKKKPATPAPKQESTDEFELELEEAMEQELAKPSSPPPPATPATNKRKHDAHAAPPDTPEAPGKKRKTDAASPTAPIPPPSTPPLPPAKATTPQPPSPQSPTPYHTTPSPPSEPTPDEQPFRAPGHHGPHGTFLNHPSLLTGRGHQVPPSEWSRNLSYQSLRYNFFRHTCPYYPFTDRARTIRAHEGNVRGLRELREMERWMRGYRERWPGECVGHLWDCGCVNLGYYERVGGGEVSEEE